MDNRTPDEIADEAVSLLTEADVSQALREVADEIRRAGWCQGQLWADDGRVCAMGAMYSVLARYPDYEQRNGPSRYINYIDVQRALFYKVQERLISTLGTKSSGFVWSITDWNDTRGRTLAQVLAALERAAEIGEPEKRRVLAPREVPAAPMTPDSPLWTAPAPEEPKREREPA